MSNLLRDISIARLLLKGLALYALWVTVLGPLAALVRIFLWSQVP